MNRRQLLVTSCAASTLTLSGCLGGVLSGGGDSGGSAPELADEPTQTGKITVDDAGSGFQLGRAVDVDGDTAVLTALGDSSTPKSVHVYRRSGGSWERQARFECESDTVAIDDGTVACIQSDGEAALIFEEESGAWEEVASVEFESSRGIMSRVDVDGDRVLIGGKPMDTSEERPAEILEREDGTWHHGTSLVPAGDGIPLGYGNDVALAGDTAFVAAHAQDNGVVYVWERTDGTWVEAGRLEPGASGYERFGTSVAVDGDRALVGMSGGIDTTNSVYVCERSGGSWELGETLPYDGGSEDYGYSVEVGGSTALVGNDQTEQTGLVHVYKSEDGSWRETAVLSPEEETTDDSFGGSIALSGDTAVIGADEDEEVAGSAGAGFVFE